MSIALADRSPLFVLQKQAAGLIVSQVCRNKLRNLLELFDAIRLAACTRFEQFLTADSPGIVYLSRSCVTILWTFLNLENLGEAIHTCYS